MSQGPFHQALYDKMKAHGLTELHNVPNKCEESRRRDEKASNSAGNSRSGTPGKTSSIIYTSHSFAIPTF